MVAKNSPWRLGNVQRVLIVAVVEVYPGKNVRRDPANPTWDPRLIPGGIPPEIGGIPPGIPPGIMERPGRDPR